MPQGNPPRPGRGLAAGLGRRVRSIPPVVAVLTFLFAALGVLHSFLTPLGSAPDENTHADMVFWLAEGNPYPDYDERLVSKSAVDALYVFGNALAPNVPAKLDTVTDLRTEPFGDLRPEVPDGDRYNQMAQHPPLYYEVTAALVRLDRRIDGGARAWFEEWHRLRLLSFAPVVILPLAAWATARRLGGDRDVAVTAAAFTLAVPQVLHISSALNNDGYLLIVGGVLAWQLAGVLRRGSRPLAAVGIGLTVGLGLLIKGQAVMLPIWVAIVFGRRARRYAGERRRLVLDLVLAGVTTTVVAGWWWIDNLVRHGTFAPSTESSLYTSQLQPPGFEPDLPWYVVRFAAWLPQRFFGMFGWLAVPMGRWIAVALIASTAGAVAFAFGRPRPGTSRGDLAVILSILPLLVCFVFLRALGLYRTTGQTPFIQGRYLFAAVVPLAVVVAVGAARALGRWAPLTVLSIGMVAQVAAVRVVLRAFWGEPDASWGRRLESLRAWNPGLVDPLWWGLGVVVPATLAAFALVVRHGRRSAPLGRGGPEVVA